jgi:L-aminopeptidase/D-esterase-like protein
MVTATVRATTFNTQLHKLLQTVYNYVNYAVRKAIVAAVVKSSNSSDKQQLTVTTMSTQLHKLLQTVYDYVNYVVLKAIVAALVKSRQMAATQSTHQ